MDATRWWKLFFEILRCKLRWFHHALPADFQEHFPKNVPQCAKKSFPTPLYHLQVEAGWSMDSVFLVPNSGPTHCVFQQKSGSLDQATIFQSSSIWFLVISFPPQTQLSVLALIEVESNIVFCYCSSSILKFDILCILGCFCASFPFLEGSRKQGLLLFSPLSLYSS